MFKKSKEVSIGLTDVNLETYLKNQYSTSENDTIKCKRKLSLPVTPFLQKDYGGDMDCTITSVATILYYICNSKYKMVRSFDDIYNTVLKYAEKYGYSGKLGTLPIFNKAIFDYAAKDIGLVDVKTKCSYVKDRGFDFEDIMTLIRKNMPLTISIWKDGRNYYSNHTVNIIGFNIMSVGEKEVRFLTIYDNWTKIKSYIDYEKLNSICCINYVPVA